MPKARKCDIVQFLNSARIKFLDLHLDHDDDTTLIGLPQPIHRSVGTLRTHIYKSMAELQAERDILLNKYPFRCVEACSQLFTIRFLCSQKETVTTTPAEQLYRQMLPHIPQYSIALLKLLLASAPASKSKTDAINVLCDCVRQVCRRF